MEKLTIEQVAPYLAYKLKCHCMGEWIEGTEYNDNPIPKILEITSINDTYVEVNHGLAQFHYDETFPILHSLSMLTKEIEVDGERFIPLVKLAETEFKGCDFISNYRFSISDEYPLGGDDCIEFTNWNHDTCQLLYSSQIGCFVFFNLTTNLNITPCLYNKEMVKLLYKWHFAIDIPEHLYIDKSTIKN